jgi:hypothetical protein
MTSTFSLGFLTMCCGRYRYRAFAGCPTEKRGDSKLISPPFGERYPVSPNELSLRLSGTW